MEGDERLFVYEPAFLDYLDIKNKNNNQEF